MKGNVKFLIIVFAMVLVAVYVVQPMMDEGQAGTQMVTGVTYDVGDMIPVVESEREQTNIDLDDEWLVYEDFATGNWNVCGYEIQSVTTVGISSEIENEVHPHSNGNQTVWSYNDAGTYYVAGMDMDNLTKWSELVPDSSQPYGLDVWEDVVYFSTLVDVDECHLYSYEPYTDTLTELSGISTLTVITYIDVWGTDMRIAGSDSDGSGIFYYNVTTETLIKLDSIYSSGVGGIYDGKIVWADGTPDYEIKYYDVDTGRTESVAEPFGSERGAPCDIYGDWIVWTYYGYSPAGMSLQAYNIESEENITLIPYGESEKYGWGGVQVLNNTVYFTVETDEIEYSDIYKIVITGTESPDDVSPEDEYVDFFLHYWFYIVISIVVGVASIYLVIRHYGSKGD